MITIEKSVIDSMAANKDYVTQFPFLRTRKLDKDSGAKCNRCPRKNKILGGEKYYERVMKDIIMMSPSKKAILKKMLGTDRITVFHLNDEKRIVRTVI